MYLHPGIVILSVPQGIIFIGVLRQNTADGLIWCFCSYSLQYIQVRLYPHGTRPVLDACLLPDHRRLPLA